MTTKLGNTLVTPRVFADAAVAEMSSGATVSQLHERLTQKAELLFLPKARRDAEQIRRSIRGIRGVSELQDRVAFMFGYTRDDLLGTRRYRNLTLARQVCCYLLRRHLGYSFPEIGRIMGKDHTSVCHACRHIAAVVTTDPGLEKMIDEIIEGLE